jgi:hypothetical protein
MTPESSETSAAEARAALTSYRDGLWTLGELIEWAERLESSGPADPWLARVAENLANPLLCREEAMAFVRDLLGD